MSDNTSTN